MSKTPIFHFQLGLNGVLAGFSHLRLPFILEECVTFLLRFCRAVYWAAAHDRCDRKVNMLWEKALLAFVAVSRAKAIPYDYIYIQVQV